MQLTPLPSALSLRNKAERVKTLRDASVSRLGVVVKDIKRLEGEGLLLDAVETFIRQLIDQEVTVGVQAVEQLQTEGLQAVFDDQDIRVKAVVEIQRGKVSVDLVTVQKTHMDTEIEGSATDSFGGAVSTVQSILLRLIIIRRRGLRPILLLDESLPAVNSRYLTNMGKFLSELCKRLELDILLVSFDQSMVEAADKAYRISRRDGHAKFEVVK